MTLQREPEGCGVAVTDQLHAQVLQGEGGAAVAARTVPQTLGGAPGESGASGVNVYNLGTVTTGEMPVGVRQSKGLERIRNSASSKLRHRLTTLADETNCCGRMRRYGHFRSCG